MSGVNRRCFAALRLLRMLLVAVSVCLLGAASLPERSDPRLAAGDEQARAQAVEVPAPGPAVYEETDDDPRGTEDDDLAHGPRNGLPLLAGVAARVTMIRGPPPAESDAVWQPRSSRGPPAQV